MSNLCLRLLAAAIGIPVLLSAAMYGGWWLMVVIVSLQLMLLWEWHRLSASIGTDVGPLTLLFPVAGLDAFVFGHHGIMVEAICIAALYVWVLSAVFRRARAPLRQLGFGALYLLWAALPLALWLPLTEMSDSTHHGSLGTLGILLAATWLCDSAAYFGGRSLGKHKLYPQASPNKTIEGAVFGVLGAAALLPVMSLFAFARPNLWDYVALPLIVGVGGQIGDLIESMIKREVDIKDSSTLIPGHGGFLDRFDSLLLATPLYFAYLLLFPSLNQSPDHSTVALADSGAPGANPKVVEMFNRISTTYDRLNRVFSMGVDRSWRKQAVRSLELQAGMRVLDCSAGTGDMAFEAQRQCPGIHTTLLDPAPSMLEIARTKAEQRSITQYDLKVGAAEAIQFADGTFDRYMVAFGIRNFRDLELGMKELRRVLKPGGKGVILEFTPDRSAVIDRLFKAYMWWVMRPVGGAVSSDPEAYKYLAETIQRFPSSTRLMEIFQSAGYSRVEAQPLSLGIATRFLLTK